MIQHKKQTTFYRMPCDDGEVLDLGVRRPLTEADWTRMLAWLDLMKDVLVEQPQPDQQPEPPHE